MTWGKKVVNPKLVSLENVSNILIQFSPFTAKSKNARMLLTLLQVRSLQRTNTRTALQIQVKHDLSPSRIEVEYSDKSKWVFAPHKFSIVGLIKMFEEKRMRVANLQKV